MRFRPYPVPEFPTDNHAIHLGASWLCLSPTGSPRAVRRPPTRVQLTPLPAPVAEVATSGSRFVSSPLPPKVGDVPVPPASLMQSLLAISSPSTPGSFKVQVPNAHLLSDLARPKRSDEYHVDNVPGPLLSQLWQRLESDLPLSELTIFQDHAVSERALDPHSGQHPEHGVEGLALAELAILEPEASLSPPVAELVLSEADASVPPPVAELLESLPTTPAALLEAEAAIDAELLEVLSALQRFDQADGVNDATASHHLDSLLPESGIQPTSHLISSGATAEPQSLDDLANAIADALCAEFAPPESSPVFDPAMSRAEQRAVAPQLKYPQLAPEPQATAEQTSPQPASDQAPPNQRVAAPDSAKQNNHAAIAHADQFASFVSALSGVAMAAGHSRAAAVLPRLLAGKLVDCSALPDEVIDCLSRQNIAHPRGSCVEPSPEFIASSAAWGELLRGQSEDMSACAETLDHFAANLLCALMGEGADRQGIRRELRKRGVAAFGMLERAA